MPKTSPMKRELFVIALIPSSFAGFSQEDQKCSVTVLRKTFDRMDRLKERDIRSFLMTFDPGCDKLVDFSEWSNEILFDVLNEYPKEVLEVLEKDQKRINVDEILTELSAPVTDKVNIHELINKIDQIKGFKEMKNKVIEYLQKTSVYRY
jgi:hypothetical protein